MSHDLHAISASLAQRIESLATHFLGEPSRAHSSKTEWRYGRHGSFSVVVGGDKRGACYDYEQGQGGHALWLIQRCRGGSFRDALDWAVGWLGGAVESAPVRKNATEKKAQPDDSDDRIMSALNLWGESRDAAGTLVEKYLRGRGAWPAGGLHDLRFHPACPMGSARVPAMIGLMRNVRTETPQGVHRTALVPDGSGRDQTVGKKMMGSKKDSAIMLVAPSDLGSGLGIAEGIENAGTLMVQGWAPVWCALDAGALKEFPLIGGIEHLTIFADADESGVGQTAARACAARWREAGRLTTVHIPPPGTDWNDTGRGVPS